MKAIHIVSTSLLLLGIASSSFAQHRGDVSYKLEEKQFNLKSFNSGIKDTTARLDTTRVYYRHDPRPTITAKNGKYLMLQFHNNGMVQLFTDTQLRIQPSEDQNDIDYYVVENENEIRMEMYRDAMTDKGWWAGKVYKNSIVFHKVNNTTETMVFTLRD